MVSLQACTTTTTTTETLVEPTIAKAEPIVETIEEPTLRFDKHDIELIARVVYAESRGESNEGQQAVVQTIINRLDSELFPDTINNVIRRPGQFVVGKRFTQKELDNVNYVIDNGFDMPSDVFYFATYVSRGTEWKKIGGHYFEKQ